MSIPRIDLLLHPVRMRIISLFGTGHTMTTAEIASFLPEVPQATLYRHIRKLTEAHILKIHSSERIRGAVEITYGLAPDGTNALPELSAPVPAATYEHLFAAYIGHLLSQFAAYIRHPDANPAKDGLLFRQAALWLNEQEFVAFSEAVGSVIQKALHNKPGSGRTMRTLNTIFLPAVDGQAEKEHNQ